MSSTAGTAGAAAAGAMVVATGFGWASSSPVQLESHPTYEPPARHYGSFKHIPRSSSADKTGQLAWAVKNLDVQSVQSILEKWPHGATLIDDEHNTLFHLLAYESKRAAAQPDVAAEVMQLLLRTGWDVVDQKNLHGHRAQIVAAQTDAHGPVVQLLEARSHDYVEQLRSQEPLPLIGESSPCPWKWLYHLQDEQRRCYAGVLSSAIPKELCKDWMDTVVEKAPWVGSPNVPRKVAWFVDPDFADVPYEYGGLSYAPTVFPPWMQEIRREVCSLCGIPPEQYPNSCNVNLYPDHKGVVDWHSDDEVMFQGLAGDTSIISFSLGSPRDFCWRLQGTTQQVGCTPLGDGDIMTMEGLFQKHYKHSVPESSTPCGRRVNFTFRWILVKSHAVDAKTKGTAA